jgi:hypothetical protein
MSIWILDIYPAPGILPIIATSEASKRKIDETADLVPETAETEGVGVGDGRRRRRTREALAAETGGASVCFV